MTAPFVGTESLAAGILTPYALRSKHVAIYPDVYIPRGAELTAPTRARAAWLWSRRRGIVAGRSAAALHGAKWVSEQLPAILVSDNRRPPNGIRTWSDSIAESDATVVDGVTVTSPARTAFDIACRYPTETAVAAIDALARAASLTTDAILAVADRHRGRRGIRDARATLNLIDAGAESPRETWLRLLLVAQGFPRPTTQIPVYDEFGVLIARFDLGWESLKIAVDYDGDHHRTTRTQFYRDIRRAETVANLGWTLIRITANDLEGEILHRVHTAFARRTQPRT